MKKLLSIVLALTMVLSLEAVLPVSAAGVEAPEKTLSIYHAEIVDYSDHKISYIGEVSAAEVEADLHSSAGVYSEPKANDTEVEYYGRSALAKLSNGAALVQAYDRICAGVEARQDAIDLSGIGLKYQEIGGVFFTCYYEHGEYFWLDNQYAFSSDGSSIIEFYPSYLFTADELSVEKPKFDSAVEKLLDGIDMSLDEFEREKLVHDRLALNTDYDEAAVTDTTDFKAHTAYGCVVEASCVCDGYAKAFSYLLRRVGIQSQMVAGTAGGGGHAWNIVRINGKYYQADLTWDDPVPTNEMAPLFYSYFNLTDSAMAKDHNINPYSFPYSLPACTATEDNYFTHYNARYSVYDYDDFVDIAKVSRIVLPGQVVVYFDDTTLGETANGAQGIGRASSSPQADARKIAEAIGIIDYTDCKMAIWSDGYETLTLYGDTSGVGDSSEKEDLIASGYCGGEGDGTNLSWVLKGDGTLTISGDGEMANWSEINQQPWLSKSDSISSVVFNGGVTSIGDEAFAGCWNLTSIEIPNSVTSIGNYAFSICSKLTSIEIPKSVTSMGWYVFEDCENLTDIYCEAKSQPEGWDEDWLGNCSAKVHWRWEPGDFDGDGVVTMKDAVYYIGWIGAPFLPQYQIDHDVNLDFNKDGKYTMADAVYFIGWIGAPFLPQYKIEW